MPSKLRRRVGQVARRAAGRPARLAARTRIPVTAEAVPRWSACYAPHSSMYLDQHGKVRACCQNTGLYLGDVTKQTLREIWESADAERMRNALEQDDYSAGCEFCEWQVREGNEAIVFARGFDEWEPAERRAPWPRQMEFSLTNTCNLQCVMCNGDWSSTIRAKREGRPPLPVVYDESFYEQLAEFLPHLDAVEFLGGEPFLGREPLRVMEMLGELETPPRVTITTNGTIYTPRVARIVELLQPSIVISLDGASNETYDQIRVGAHFDDVIANLDRFHAELGPLKISLTTCLMRSNWHEFAKLLTLAEARGLYVGVNVVRFPEHQSLYQLPADELAPVVEAMQATEVHLTGTRAKAWEGHVAALAHRLEVVRAPHPELGPSHGLPGAPRTMIARNTDLLSTSAATSAPADTPMLFTSRWPWMPFPEAPDPDAVPLPPLDLDRCDVAVFVVDTEGRVTVHRHDPGLPASLANLDGGRIEDLVARLAERFGPPDSWPMDFRRSPEDDDRFRVHLLEHEHDGRDQLVGTARRDVDGTLVGVEIVLRRSAAGS